MLNIFSKSSSKVERDESYFGDEGNLYQPSTCSVCVCVNNFCNLKKNTPKLNVCKPSQLSNFQNRYDIPLYSVVDRIFIVIYYNPHITG